MQVLIVLGRIVFVVLIYLFMFRVLTALLADLREKGVLRRPERAYAVLEVVNGAENMPRGTVFRVESRGLKVGRGKQNDVIVPDHFTSIEHARFRMRRGTLTIEDLGSTNGTYVNGERIDTPVDLVVGDYVKIGSIIFKVREVAK